MLLRSSKYESMLRQSHQCGRRIKNLRVWFNDHLISQESYEAAEPVIVVIQANYTWKKCNITPSHLWDFLKINDFSQCFEFAFQNWIYLPASCDTSFDKFSSWSVHCFKEVVSEFLTVHHSRFKLTFIMSSGSGRTCITSQSLLGFNVFILSCSIVCETFLHCVKYYSADL